ncbi:AraC family transcriptional regulator [Mucilaginibacter aquaedulcis]|uniref:AraC family transcriptional regulator n=1 Tax=Mucilaginibacter aquaedulcis TaxID=1187081 RepID=UPI0025B4A40A|nr:helix-turn-helix transcriptional regulator [Mucilaginibacter aquaedulcis]MDN3547767.1 helix-turn-helix transcriptional regulator [Mucilaginibacter aquaedulcis]
MGEKSFLQLQADQDLKDSFSVNHLPDQAFDTLSIYRANYHRIFIINDGEGSLQIDDSVFELKSNELLLIAKGQLYGFHAGTQIIGYELSFGDCFWEKAPGSASNCKAVLFNNASANQQLPLNSADHSELDILFNTLYREFIKEDYPNKLDALAAYLKIIMIKIANVNASLIDGYDNYENQLYRRFIELVSTQYQTTREVADFAKQLGISARKLSDLCRRCGGKGAKDIINGQLIAEAKRSLQFSSKPVKEIAFHLNFSTPDQFSHFFKKNTQISPNNYRDRFVNIGM